MADEGVRALAVTAYTSFVSPDQADRAANVEALVRHIELARDLGAGAVRAFAGIREDEAPEDELLQRVAGELAGVADFALDAGVVIAIEQHDDFDRAAQIAALLDLVDHPAVSAVWDVANGWAAGEPPDAGLRALGGRISYAQLKDGAGPREDWRPCAFGEGDVPLQAAVRGLLASGTAIPISVEWLRAWSEDLAPPELALPETLRYVEGLVAAASEP
jgi:sugar phosphate isomerase/epimerase